MKRALLLALSVAACRSSTPPTNPNTVNVGQVTSPPLSVVPSKPSCGPDEASALDVEAAIGKTIRGICIRGVDKDAAIDVKKYLGLTQIGKPIDPDYLGRDVASLYRSGLYVRVDVLARAQDDGVELTFELEPRPIVQSVEVSAPPDFDAEDDVRKLKGQIYSPAMIARHAERLSDHHTLTSSVSRVPGGVSIRIVITRR